MDAGDSIAQCGLTDRRAGFVRQEPALLVRDLKRVSCRRDLVGRRHVNQQIQNWHPAQHDMSCLQNSKINDGQMMRFEVKRPFGASRTIAIYKKRHNITIVY